MTWEDPMVAETRALRQELMDEVGNDLGALVKYLQERELDHPERLVSLPPRKPMAATSVHENESGESLPRQRAVPRQMPHGAGFVAAAFEDAGEVVVRVGVVGIEFNRA